MQNWQPPERESHLLKVTQLRSSDKQAGSRRQGIKLEQGAGGSQGWGRARPRRAGVWSDDYQEQADLQRLRFLPLAPGWGGLLKDWPVWDVSLPLPKDAPSRWGHPGYLLRDRRRALPVWGPGLLSAAAGQAS